MKKILLSFLILSTSISFSGGFSFPNVEYSYARLYLFNTQPPGEEYFYDFDIYKNGRYANSKIGNGWEVSTDMVQKMNSIFRLGVDAMVMGLSSCYIPRHGIIFFDKIGNPVASISACFECERISFWSSEPLPPFKEKFSKKAGELAQKQFADLIVLLESNKIPVFKSEPEYGQFSDDDSLYSCKGEIIFDFKEEDAFNGGKFTSGGRFAVADVKSWLLPNSNYQLKQTTDTIYIRRGEEREQVVFTSLNNKGGTQFSFSSAKDDAYLTQANINNSAIILPNGISVGMSLEQVQNSFSLWDGIANPASIIASYPHLSIRYFIEKRTLVRIELVFS